MAEKGWTAQVAAAAGVAAGTGAAQLGLGYGLGVVVWPALPTADDSVWLGSLGWATWIAASSTVFGAVIADRLGRAVGGAWRFALAASAAVGALLTVALIALPARAAVRTDTFSPQTIAAGYALIGVVLGLLIAYWAVVSKPVAANLIATAAWLWSLAVAAVIASVFWHRPSATYLTSWQFAAPEALDGQYGTIYWPSAVLTLLASLIIGVVGALPAARRGDLGIGTASSGAVGPLLVAAAFFVLAPQLTGALGPLESAYLIAPYALLAGLAGSALTVALGQSRATRRAQKTPPPNPPGSAATSPAPETSSGPKPTAETKSAAETRSTAESGATARSEVATVPTQPARSKTSQPKPASPTPTQDQPKASNRSEPPAPSPERSRPSFLGRLWRSSAAQNDTEAAVATGRAKAPTAPPAASPPAASPPAATTPPAPRKPSTQPTPRKPSTSGPTALTSPPQAPPPITPPPTAPAPTGPHPATSSATPRGKAPVAQPGNAPRPTATPKPARPDSRSTVAPPPTAPPVAKINPPHPPDPTTSTPPNAASSDKTPTPPKPPATDTAPPPPARPARKPQPSNADTTSPKPTPTKATPTKSTPAKRPPAKTTPAKATQPAASPQTSPLWVDDEDTTELPAQEPKKRGLRRFGRRSGEDQPPE